MKKWPGEGKAKWWGTYIDTVQMELISIFYSEDDKGYIAFLVRMPSQSAFGDTPGEAIREMEIVIELGKEMK